MGKNAFGELRSRIKGYFGKKNREINEIFEKCFMNTLETTCKFEEDGSVFVVTGDIPAMWLRDSSAQVMQYLFFADDANVRNLIKGVLKKQVEFIIRDTYANAFMRNASDISEWDGKYLTDRCGKLIWERKFELDSLCYPMFLACKYYEKTYDCSIFNKEFLWAFEQIKTTIEIEKKHSERSTYYYRFWCENEYVGRDNDPKSEKGLIWTGYRPSDDKCEYHYHIPDNMFLVSVVHKLSEIFKKIRQTEYADYCKKLEGELVPLIEKHGTAYVDGLGKIYVSETNCLGNYLADDDANIPSLLAIPYLEYPYTDKQTYKNTREYILSKRNKYFYKGKILEGIGSPHTPQNRVWPLSVAMQGITSNDKAEVKKCFEMLIKSTNGEHLMHEGVDADDVSKYSRPWFAWANSMFAYFVLEKEETIKSFLM